MNYLMDMTTGSLEAVGQAQVERVVMHENMIKRRTYMNGGKAAFLILMVTSFLGLYAPDAYSATVLLDDFNNNSLDPAWTVSFSNVSNWTYSESGTNLEVTDINPEAMNTYATVSLSRSFQSLQDFTVTSKFSWDSYGDLHSMQEFTIYLFDESSNQIAAIGYSDGWYGSRGEKYAYARSNYFNSGYDTLGFAGSVEALVTREGNAVTVYWNGDPILTGYAQTPLSSVMLVFSYYPYEGNGGMSTFGKEAIDLIEVEGSPVPIPPTVWIFGSALLGLVGIRGGARSQESAGVRNADAVNDQRDQVLKSGQGVQKSSLSIHNEEVNIK